MDNQRTGPVAKKPRLDDSNATAAAAHPPVQRPVPSIASLLQIPAGLPSDPSPGAMHGCRIATWHTPGTHSYSSVLASGASVFWSQVSLQHAAQPEQGKEGILLPVRMKSSPVARFRDLKHAGEVQALALTKAPQQQDQQLLLASVDAFGFCNISSIDVSAASYSTPTAYEDAGAGEAAAVAPTVLRQNRLQPVDGCREGGWAGVCLSSSDSNAGALSVATARGFAKDVTIYDAETGSAVRTYYTCLNPYALNFLPAGVGGDSSSLLAVTESHMISLWDARVGGSSSGCVQRLATASIGNPLYSLDWCTAQGGLLGSAGAERSVVLTEPRKWRTLTKWSGATRLAIHSLAFLDQDPQYAVLAGLDMEVLCDQWDKPSSNSRAFQSKVPAEDDLPTASAAAPGAPGSGDRTRSSAAAAAAAGSDAAVSGGFAFRGDSRWLGLCKAAGSDSLAGCTAAGSLVYADLS